MRSTSQTLFFVVLMGMDYLVVHSVPDVKFKLDRFIFCPDSQYAISAFIRISMRQCAYECAQRDYCGALAFDRLMNTCYLYETYGELRLLSHVKRRCAVVRKSDIGIANSQNEIVCEGEGLSNAMSCMSQRCPLFTLNNGEINGNTNYIHSVKKFTCNPQYREKESKNTTVCQPGGTWEYIPECVYVGILLFRGTPGCGINSYFMWIQGAASIAGPECHKYTPSSCDQHFRHNGIDTWSSLMLKQVRYSMFKDGVEVAYIVFNGTGSTNRDWFSESRILDSSWPDIIKTGPKNFFSLTGLNIERTFCINLLYNGCPGDVGWTLVSEQNSLPCNYDQHSSYPQFLYSSSTTAQLAQDFVHADVMTVHGTSTLFYVE